MEVLSEVSVTSPEIKDFNDEKLDEKCVRENV